MAHRFVSPAATAEQSRQAERNQTRLAEKAQAANQKSQLVNAVNAQFNALVKAGRMSPNAVQPVDNTTSIEDINDRARRLNDYGQMQSDGQGGYRIVPPGSPAPGMAPQSYDPAPARPIWNPTNNTPGVPAWTPPPQSASDRAAFAALPVGQGRVISDPQGVSQNLAMNANTGQSVATPYGTASSRTPTWQENLANAYPSLHDANSTGNANFVAAVKAQGINPNDQSEATRQRVAQIADNVLNPQKMDPVANAFEKPPMDSSTFGSNVSVAGPQAPVTAFGSDVSRGLVNPTISDDAPRGVAAQAGAAVGNTVAGAGRSLFDLGKDAVAGTVNNVLNPAANFLRAAVGKPNLPDMDYSQGRYTANGAQVAAQTKADNAPGLAANPSTSTTNDPTLLAQAKAPVDTGSVGALPSYVSNTAGSDFSAANTAFNTGQTSNMSGSMLATSPDEDEKLRAARTPMTSF